MPAGRRATSSRSTGRSPPAAAISRYGADTITTTGGLVNAGTGTVRLNALTGVGTSTTPIQTQAGRLSLNAGSGGAYVTEADGAALIANVTGGGALVVTNTAGTLTVNGGEAVRTDGGLITLSSGDDVAMNGYVGSSAATGAAPSRSTRTPMARGPRLHAGPAGRWPPPAISQSTSTSPPAGPATPSSPRAASAAR